MAVSARFLQPAQRPAQPISASREEPLRPLDAPRGTEDFVRRGWLTTKRAASYLGFDDCDNPVGAFWKFVKRHGVPSFRRGRVLLFDPADLDRAVGARRRSR